MNVNSKSISHFFRGALALLLYVYCGVPVSKHWHKPYRFAFLEANRFRLFVFLHCPGIEPAAETVTFRFFRGEPIPAFVFLRCPGIETLVETVVASHYVSAVFSFLPHSIGSPVKGSRQLCCRGVELKPVNYQLLALRCGQRSLVGNGFIRSALLHLPTQLIQRHAAEVLPLPSPA